MSAHTAALRGAVEDKAAWGKTVADAGTHEGFDAARALVAAGEGRRRMDVVRSHLDAIDRTARTELRAETQRAATLATRATTFAALLAAALLVAIAVFFVVVRHDVRARRDAVETLRRSEERFRLLVDGVRDFALMMIDPEGRVTSWNAGGERVIGWTADEVIGQHIRIFYAPEDVASGRPAHELAEAARTGRFEDESRRVHKDGTTFWANVIVTALHDEAGTLRGFAKITRDVGERKAAELELRAFAERLERSNRELQDFAMIASHDLQEPLRKVQMFGDRLVEELGDDLGPTGRDYVARMQKAGARGQALVQGLLAYSRITTKAQPMEPVDLGVVAAEVVSDLDARIAEVGARVAIEPLPTIDADPMQMRQLFQNLVGNALKFHRDGAPPTIRVSAEPTTASGAAWAIRVEDDGIGFDEKYLDRIFKLFQRLHERGAYEGAGMGLAICRKIVERHGGSITAQSTPGAGTTFVVTLPARSIAEGRAA